MASEYLLSGLVELRPDDRGKFDELVIGEGHGCRVHFEMMSDSILWVGLYPDGVGDRCVHVTIIAKGKLQVIAHEA